MISIQSARIILTVALASYVRHTFATGSKPTVISTEQDLFPVTIVHINDFHARFEETNEMATTCKDVEICIGGYARAVKMIRALLENAVNPIYLNAGDNFQGTLWYALGRWNVTAQFLNMLPADAITLGNHEFDHGIAGVVPFMENLMTPVVLANVIDTFEPTFQGKYKKSIVIDRYERKIGVIGVLISTVHELANVGKLQFRKEEIAIKEEAEKLKNQGVDIIIVLSHCGLSIDYRIAKAIAPYVDVIVGGHSHTFMYTVEEGSKPPGPDHPSDLYPAVVESDGHKVLIVHASAYMKYVGDLTVYFDKDGNVAKWSGNPKYLDHDIVPDSNVMDAITPWKEVIDAKGKRVLGHTKVPLKITSCFTKECNLGNFAADALVHYYITELSGRNENQWTEPIIGIINCGGVRTEIGAGPISFMDLATTMPFENTIDTFDLLGEHVKELFEFAAKAFSSENDQRNFMQVSGMRVVYNPTNEENNRVRSIEVLAMPNDVRRVPRYEPLDPKKYYKFITSSFIAEGGDAFDIISKHKKNHKKGNIDTDVVTKYLEERRIIYTGLDNRIAVDEHSLFANIFYSIRNFVSNIF
ncbi:apyrase-like isoform X2 [Contarinia nasturtii]|uniref:apyrase-like isoform X2 n=1 Tax=Contarinia nasturtii TaxID=265458 RepID=UPI0012D3FE38|nr:apyrase-like isoform X2 [Contarinia nasturtii]